jgi:hypothetical protein
MIFEVHPKSGIFLLSGHDSLGAFYSQSLASPSSEPSRDLAEHMKVAPIQIFTRRPFAICGRTLPSVIRRPQSPSNGYR